MLFITIVDSCAAGVKLVDHTNVLFDTSVAKHYRSYIIETGQGFEELGRKPNCDEGGRGLKTEHRQ